MQKISTGKNFLTILVIIILLIPIALILYFSLSSAPTKPIIPPENQTGPEETSIFGSDFPGPYSPEGIENMSLEIVSANPELMLDPMYHGALFEGEYIGYWQLGNTIYIHNITYRNENYTNFLIMHPLSETEPNILSQNITLPSEKRLFILARVSNINYMSEILPFIGPCPEIADNIFIITIKDLATGEEKDVYKSKVISDGKWHFIGAEISEYKGKSITFFLKSYAGGNVLWCGEWGAVDQFYIAAAQ